jgi:hypothetical protein
MASAADDTTSNAASGRWLTSFGGLLDDHHGYLLDGSIGYAPDRNSMWVGDFNRSTASETTPGFNTNAASLAWLRDIGPSGFQLKAHWFENVGLLQGRDLTLQVPWRADSWHVALVGQYRHSTFDAFQADTVVHRQNGSQVAVSSLAGCDLDNIGYGGELGLDGSRWSTYVRDLQYHYDSLSCGYSSTGLGALAHPDLAEFRQLAPTVTGRLASKAAASLRGTQASNSLLASEFDAGGRYGWGSVKLGLEYERGREELAGLISNTYTALLDYPVATHSNLELQAGTTHGDVVGTVNFAGVAFRTLF